MYEVFYYLIIQTSHTYVRVCIHHSPPRPNIYTRIHHHTRVNIQLYVLQIIVANKSARTTSAQLATNELNTHSHYY